MSRTRIYRTEGIVLNRTDWGEADRMITLFTPAYGKLRLLAPGARKPQSRKSGHLELFTRGHYVIARGRTFDKITQAETQDYFEALHGALDRAALASTAAELVDRSLGEHDENAPLYDLLLDAISQITTEPNPLLALRYFEMHALGHLGYQPQLHHCVRCEEEIEPIDQWWASSEGGVVCPACGREESVGLTRLSLPLLKVLRLLQSNAWERVRGLRLAPPEMQALENFLNGLVRLILERDLKSERFLREVRRIDYSS